MRDDEFAMWSRSFTEPIKCDDQVRIKVAHPADADGGCPMRDE